MIGEGHRTRVIPFFRASVCVDQEGRRLFSGLLPQDEFNRRLKRTSSRFRQNVSRIFAASRLAASIGGELVFVEGWRSNRIRRAHGRRQKLVTGSWMSCLILRMLQRRGLTDYRGRVFRANLSRCTAEEARSVLVLREGSDSQIIGIAGSPCPSASRACRYLRLLGGARHKALAPRTALARPGLALADGEMALLRATEPRTHEKVMGWIQEGANWVVHFLCRAVAPGDGNGLAVEERLAHRLRRD